MHIESVGKRLVKRLKRFVDDLDYRTWKTGFDEDAARRSMEAFDNGNYRTPEEILKENWKLMLQYYNMEGTIPYAIPRGS